MTEPELCIQNIFRFLLLIQIAASPGQLNFRYTQISFYKVQHCTRLVSNTTNQGHAINYLLLLITDHPKDTCLHMVFSFHT